MDITDAEFTLFRQRNQILSEANGTISQQNNEIVALRRALTKVRRELELAQAEKLGLQMQVTRLSRRH